MRDERDDPVPTDDDDDRDHGRGNAEVSGLLDYRLEVLQGRALDAWRELGPHGDGCPIEESSLAFVDGVMDRLTATARRPQVVPIDVPLPPPSAVHPAGRWRRWAAGALATAAGIAVTAGVLVADPGPPGDASSAPAVLGLVQSSSPVADAPNLPTQGRAAPTLPKDFDRWVEGYIADYGRNYGPAFKFHGVIVVARRGEITYSRGFGVANRTGDPNSTQTRFRLGLLTEPLTAVAVMQLVEAELLQLDAPIARYLTDYPRGEQITVRDLLTHRSGIPNYTDDPAFHRWKSQPHATDAVLARFADLPLEFEPGSDTAPSNSNYFLLGAIIERVTGQTFGDFVRDNQFLPAAMTASSFGDVFESREQAQGNVWNDEEVLEPPGPIDMSTFGGAGGLVSSPADMIRWDRALREGMFLGPDALEQLSTPTDEGYGFGWVISRAYDQTLLSFPGAIDGYSGGMLRFMRDETTILVLANTEVVPGSVVAQDVAMMVYGDMPPKRNEPAEIDIAPRTHHKFVGTYSITEQTRVRYAEQFDRERFDLLARVHVQSEGDRLFFEVPGHARTWMHPMGRNRFFFKDHSGNQVSFALGADRRAQRLVVHYQDAEFELSRVSAAAER